MGLISRVSSRTYRFSDMLRLSRLTLNASKKPPTFAAATTPPPSFASAIKSSQAKTEINNEWTQLENSFKKTKWTKMWYHDETKQKGQGPEKRGAGGLGSMSPN